MNNPLFPTAEEVAARQILKDTSPAKAESDLCARAESDAAKVAQVAADDWEEIAEAVTAAELALAAAQDRARARRAAVENLEAAIFELGRHRQRVAQFSGIVDEARHPEKLVEQAISSLFQNFVSPSPQNESCFNICSTRAAQVSALRPALETKLAALDKQAEAMLAEIRLTAETENVDLPSLIALMRTGAVKIAANGREVENLPMARLFEQGYLSENICES